MDKFPPLASNPVTDVGEARPEVKKFMTKVNKTETKYECKINALTTQATHIPNLHSTLQPTPCKGKPISRWHRPRH